MTTPAYNEKARDWCDRLRRKVVGGSLDAAKGTAELLRQLITSSRLTDPLSILEEVRSVGAQVQSSQPLELVIGNIVRRVMHIIREEMQEDAEDAFIGDAAASQDQSPMAGGLSRALKPSTTSRSWAKASLHNLLDHGLGHDPSSATVHPAVAPPFAAPAAASQSRLEHMLATHAVERRGKQAAALWERRQEVIDGVNDLIEELKDIDSAIAAHALEHIDSNEVILTFGFSRTVAHFLQRAREKRDFQVVVAEGAPTLQGHTLAAQLAMGGIHTTAIADAAVYAMMARIHKVVISAHALLANGGIMAPVGVALVAAAAKCHCVPFVVLVGMYKLSPHFPHEPGVTFNDFKESSDVLSYADEAVLTSEATETAVRFNGEADEQCGGTQMWPGRPFLQVHNPGYDYIPPELISLLITDHGHGIQPSYVYRHLSDFYHRQDYQLS